MKKQILISATFFSLFFTVLSSCKKCDCLDQNKNTIIYDQYTTSYSDTNDVIDAGINSFVPNTNRGGGNNFSAYAWTQSGNPTVSRGFIKFDLSSIPTNAVIDEAYLNLYHDSTYTATAQTGENAFYIFKVDQSWDEYSITWNNQPTISSKDSVIVPKSTPSTMNFTNINVIKLVKGMVSSPNTNYGFRMSLLNETPFANAVVGSSEHSISELRPKLVIKYHYTK